MEYRPDLNFEYDYIRIVYEVILANLRTNKKIIEKELNTIVTRVQNLKKKPLSEHLPVIKTLLTKINELESKYEEISKEEDNLYTCLKERITQLQTIDEKNYSFENLKLFCEKKLSNLLLDLFLRQRFLETSRNYIEEEHICNSVEFTVFTEIQNILSSLKAKDIQPALNWCNANKSKLTKLNSQIRFLILRQQFIEIYSQGNLLEAVRFSRENFTGATADQIKDVMILLAVKSQNLEIFPKLLHLLSSERWTDLINEFQSVFFQVYCMKSESPIEILFQTGLMSLKTPFCYHTKQKHNLMCPVCCDEIGKLAQPLPASQHPVSSLLCRITGEIMDHLNQPLALPNGQVYSEKAVLEQVRANGKFVCPITNKEYKLEECKKVYIC